MTRCALQIVHCWADVNARGVHMVHFDCTHLLRNKVGLAGDLCIFESCPHNVQVSSESVLLQESAAQLADRLGDPAAVFLISSSEGKVSMVAAFSPAVVSKGLQAGKFIGTIAKICGGGGGGRPNFAQAGAKDTSKVAEALVSAKQQLMDQLQ